MEQQRLTYPLAHSSVVLDIGAYQGYFLSNIYQKYQCRIYAFEPVKRFYDRISNLQNADVRIFNYGVGAKTDEFKIGVRGDSSSIYLEAPEYETIQIRSIEDVFNDLQLKNTGVDLMKINIEGSEYDLLDSMLEKDLVKCVKHIQVQFHSYGIGGSKSPEDRRDNIREGLKKTHDESWCYPFVWESWQRR